MDIPSAPQFNIADWYAEHSDQFPSGPEAVKPLMSVLNKSSFRSRCFYHRDHAKAQKGNGGQNAVKGGYAIDSDRFPVELEARNETGRRVYFVVNDGGDSWAEVEKANKCRNHFCEFDEKHGFTVADALNTDWGSIGGVGFPAPSAGVYSGGVSPHLYFPLSETYDDPFRWYVNQCRLAQILGADPSIVDLSRVMRLPGFFNTDAKGELGRKSLLLFCEPNRESTIAEFEAALRKVELACKMDLFDCIPIGATNREDRRPGILRALISIFGQDIESEFNECFVFNAKKKSVKGSYAELLDSRGIDEIEAALDLIPPFVPKNGTFKGEEPVKLKDGRQVKIDYFRLMAGLRAEWEAGRRPLNKLISMLQQRWTEAGDNWIASTIGGVNGSVASGSFWHFARVCGYQLEKPKTPLKVTAVTDVSSANEMVSEREKVIATLMQELYQVMGSSGDTFNRRESIRTQLAQGCGLNRELVSRRLLVMLGKEFGFNIGDENDTDRIGLPADVDTIPTRDLIPGVLIEGRDAVVCAPAGSLKTTIAAMFGDTVSGGRQIPLSTELTTIKGRVIYIASDGGESAIPTVKSYARRVGTPVDTNKNWIFAGAHTGKGQSPWAYCFRDLQWLVKELQTHQDTEMPVRLVVVDTLRCVMDNAGLDSGIGPMSEAMRLMQGIAAKYNAAVLWVHHTTKSNDGIAAGHAGITEIPTSVHFIGKSKRKHNGSPVFEWTVKKHRNAPSRVVSYVVEDETGMQVVPSDTSADVQNMMLLEMYREHKDGSSARNLCMYLADQELSQSRITKELGVMRTPLGGKLVSYAKNRWWLTREGFKKGYRLAKAEIKALKEQGEEFDSSAEDMPFFGDRKQEECGDYKDSIHLPALSEHKQDVEAEEQREREEFLETARTYQNAVRAKLKAGFDFWDS